MTESQIKTSLTDLNSLVINGKLMDAFEKHYHEEIEMQENSNPAVKGKDTNRKRELEFLSNVTEFRKASVSELAVNGDTSFVIWSYDYTHKEWGVRNYTQVSVQHWKDGKIIKEQFFYGN
jgi:hypothetical protein